VWCGSFPYHEECTRGPAYQPRYYTPVGAGDGNTFIPRQLTEAEVRRIVREELARMESGESAPTAQPTEKS
jgi:hypothetical protein